MPDIIQAIRPEVSRTFPIPGFRIRSETQPAWAEVAIATSPALLFDPAARPERTRSNFYSSRTNGLLTIERGEMVYLLAPEVMQRFAGQERLYYALAIYRQPDLHDPVVRRLPPESTPYVAISSTFRNNPPGILGVPNPRGGLTGEGYGNGAVLEWGGDMAPGGEMVSVGGPAGNGAATNGTPAEKAGNGNGMTQPTAEQAGMAFAYDDGFGTDLWSQPQAYTDAASAGQGSYGGKMNQYEQQARVARRAHVRQPQMAQATGGPLVPIAGAIAGATINRIANNVGDVSWELDQWDSIKHPHNDPSQQGSADFTGTIIDVPGPIAGGILDDIAADFEVRFQHNGHSVGRVEINPPVHVNDAVGWALHVTARIMDDERVYNGRAALNVQFHYHFTRIAGADVIGIRDMKLYADGQFDDNFRWTQQSALALQQMRAGNGGNGGYGNGRSRLTYAAAGPAAAVGGMIAGAAITRILNNEGDVSWELDQLQGLKHPHNDPSQQGSAGFTTTMLEVPGPVSGGLIDDITADFEVRFQHNGHSVGNVQITNTHVNDAIGWALHVKAQIMDDANVYNGRAAVNLQFHYRFSRDIGSDVIGIRDMKLYADGQFDDNFRWTQSSVLALQQANGGNGYGRRQRGMARAAGGPAAAVAGPIADTLLTTIIDGRGDIDWKLEQLDGIKYPNDNQADAGSGPFRDAVTNVPGPWMENGFTDRIQAGFQIRWQYNGRALGNIEIVNTDTNDAAGWGLDVTANIVNDNRVFTRPGGSGATFAAIRVNFSYHFSHWPLSDIIVHHLVTLYGDGQFDFRSETTQS